MRLRTIDDLTHVDFDKGAGLVPTVIQDARNGTVLMVAWSNRQAIVSSLETGQMHLWSRSRQELWHKGATSGNHQQLVDLHLDCDRDTLLARVIPAGPACHTGAPSCFESAPTLAALDRVIAERADHAGDESYTARLLADRNLRLKKLGEEAAELVVAAADADTGRVIEEAADLLYHLLVVCRASGSGLDDVAEALAARSRPSSEAS